MDYAFRIACRQHASATRPSHWNDRRRGAGLRVVDEKPRLCISQIRVFAGLRLAPAVIITHDPRQVPDLLEPITQSGADMVLGSRLAGNISPGAMPWHQEFGNWLSAGLIRLLYGLPITDLSPYRAVLRSKLIALNMQEMTYGWPTEMIARAARGGWSIVEVPVDYHPRLGGKSKISGTLRGTLLATYYILSTIIKYSFAGKAS